MAAIPTLRSHREAIAALEKAGFDVEPIRFCKGTHLLLQLKRDGVSVRTTISGSPKGCHLRSVVSNAEILALRSTHYCKDSGMRQAWSSPQ